jgi:hypothetical protein
LLAIWLGVATLSLLVLLPVWNPLLRAWRCYADYAGAPQAQVELIEVLEENHGLFHFVDGARAGQPCSIRASYWSSANATPGDRFRVAYLDQRPGECVPVATLENSQILLWVISTLLILVLLPVLGAGFWLHHSLRKIGVPQRRMEIDPGGVVCPVCAGKMAEGYSPLLAGIHWRDAGQPLGLPHALSGLPGTVGWRGRAIVHAFRCPGCEVLTLQYGKPGHPPTP